MFCFLAITQRIVPDLRARGDGSSSSPIHFLVISQAAGFKVTCEGDSSLNIPV